MIIFMMFCWLAKEADEDDDGAMLSWDYTVLSTS